jgi:plastocyanin
MNTNRKWLAQILTLVLAAAIRIENFKFEPATLEIAAGDTVTWSNGDDEIHAVVAEDGSFHSGGIDGDNTFAHTFEKPGTYAYRCALHPQMSGTIVVH